MYEYTIDAYNYDPGFGVTNRITVVVTADTEDEAIDKAKLIKSRSTYAVIAIKDLNSTTIKKKV